MEQQWITSLLPSILCDQSDSFFKAGRVALQNLLPCILENMCTVLKPAWKIVLVWLESSLQISINRFICCALIHRDRPLIIIYGIDFLLQHWFFLSLENDERHTRKRKKYAFRRFWCILRSLLVARGCHWWTARRFRLLVRIFFAICSKVSWSNVLCVFWYHRDNSKFSSRIFTSAY